MMLKKKKDPHENKLNPCNIVCLFGDISLRHEGILGDVYACRLAALQA